METAADCRVSAGAARTAPPQSPSRPPALARAPCGSAARRHHNSLSFDWALLFGCHHPPCQVVLVAEIYLDLLPGPDLSSSCPPPRAAFASTAHRTRPSRAASQFPYPPQAVPSPPSPQAQPFIQHAHSPLLLAPLASLGYRCPPPSYLPPPCPPDLSTANLHTATPCANLARAPRKRRASTESN